MKEKVKLQAKWKKGKHKKWILVVVVVILLFVLFKICTGGGNQQVVVTTSKAERGELQEVVSTSGTIAAQQVQVLFAPASGKLVSVPVEPGDAVEAGALLAAYDTDRLEADYRQAFLTQEKSAASYGGASRDNVQSQAKLAEADTNLSVLKQQIADNKAYLKKLQSALKQSQRDTANALADESYDLCKEISRLTEEIKKIDPADTETLEKKNKKLQSLNDELSRNAHLKEMSGTSDYVTKLSDEIGEVEEKIADYEKYQAEMEAQKDSSEAKVWDSYDQTAYEADKELAGIAYREALDSYNAVKNGICAPFNGIVTSVDAVEGSSVAEGTKLLTLESSDEVKVIFQASKLDVEKLETGQIAEVTIADRSYTGRVSKINRMATLNASNTPMVGVEVSMDQPDDHIILGMDARLKIHTKEVKDALLVPAEAVNADRDGDFLYVVENGVAVRKPVICGISNDTYVEIKEGITDTDEIILTFEGNLEEGMTVAVMPQM